MIYFTYPPNQLLQIINDHINKINRIPWFCFRDLMFNAQERGLLSIRTPKEPFWWHY